MPVILLNVHGGDAASYGSKVAWRSGRTHTSLGIDDLITLAGICTWIVGFAIESIGDDQKRAFKSVQADRAWFDGGLWSMSRHPNHLGEILLWWGQWMIVAPFFAHQGAYALALACAVSPLFTMATVIHTSTIPQEIETSRKCGGDEQYKKYKARVGRLMPKLEAIQQLLSSRRGAASSVKNE